MTYVFKLQIKKKKKKYPVNSRNKNSFLIRTRIPIHRYRVLPVNDEGGIRADCRSRSHMRDNQGGIRADSRPGRDKRVVNGI